MTSSIRLGLAVSALGLLLALPASAQTVTPNQAQIDCKAMPNEANCYHGWTPASSASAQQVAPEVAASQAACKAAPNEQNCYSAYHPAAATSAQAMAPEVAASQAACKAAPNEQNCYSAYHPAPTK